MDTKPPNQSPRISRLLDDFRTCRCGARAERRYGRCRKCRARAFWRRRHQRPTQVVRRPVARPRREVTPFAALGPVAWPLITFPSARTQPAAIAFGGER